MKRINGRDVAQAASCSQATVSRVIRSDPRISLETRKRVLDAAQALYLAKLTSYPRTNCRYLPEEQQADAARILPALATLSGAFSAVADMAATADPSLKSGPYTKSSRHTVSCVPAGSHHCPCC